MIRTLTLAAVAAIAIAVPVRAQVPASRGPATQAAGARTAAVSSAVNDPLFAAAAASAGMAEVNLSEIGLQGATDPELKQFSQRMVAEHTKMNQELVNLVAQTRIAIPQTIDARAQFCAESLAGLSGEKFDHCYAKAQLVAHMDAVAIFEAEAERGQDPDIKALAAKALPHIKEHLKTIKPIAMRYEKEKHGNESASSERHGR
jgi:putative membrane protein